MVLNDDVKDSKKEHMMKLDMVVIVCYLSSEVLSTGANLVVG